MHATTARIYRLDTDPQGLYRVQNALRPRLEPHGPEYPSLAEALQGAAEAGYTHVESSGRRRWEIPARYLPAVH